MDLVPGNLMTERIGEVSIRHQDLHIAKPRCDAYAAVNLSRASDFASIGVPVIRDYLAVGEAYETIDEIAGFVARHIDSIVWNRLKPCVFGRGKVPIQLHLHPAEPLNECIDA